MIKSFDDRKTGRLFADQVVKEFQGIARRAKRKLEALHAADRLHDMRVPPSNRLEKLKGDLRGFHAIRINDRWRLFFAGPTATHMRFRLSTTIDGARHGG